MLKVNSDADDVVSFYDNILSFKEAYLLLHHRDFYVGDKVEIWDYRGSESPSEPIAVYHWSDLNLKGKGSRIPLISHKNMRYRSDQQQSVHHEKERIKFEQTEQDRLDELGRQKSLLLSSGCLDAMGQQVNAASPNAQSAMPFLSASSNSRLLSNAKPSYQYKNDLDRIFDAPRASASSSSLRGFPKGLSIEFAASEDTYFDYKGLSLRKFQKQYDLNVDDSGRFLAGSSSSDFLVAARVKSKIVGRNGDDILVGGPYNDAVKGGRGDDLIYGGRGKNRAFGGKGHDVFNLHSSGVLMIKDFDSIKDGIRFPVSMKPELLSFDLDRNSIHYDGLLIARFAGDSLLV